MGTRMTIWLSAIVWTGIALYGDNVAAAYVSLGTHVIMYMLHVIEVKVNKLLDHQSLYVSNVEIAR